MEQNVMQSKHSIPKGTSECGSWSRARCLRNVSRAGTWLDTGLRFQARARLQSPSTFPSLSLPPALTQQMEISQTKVIQPRNPRDV